MTEWGTAKTAGWRAPKRIRNIPHGESDTRISIRRRKDMSDENSSKTTEPDDTRLLDAVIEHGLHVFACDPSAWTEFKPWVARMFDDHIPEGHGHSPREAIADWLEMADVDFLSERRRTGKRGDG